MPIGYERHSTCLRTLELEPSAPPEALPKAYRRMMMLWHPDRFEPHSELWEEAREKSQAIQEAYVYLLEHPRPPVAPPPLPPPSPAPRPPSGFPSPAPSRSHPSHRPGFWILPGALAALSLLALWRMRPLPETPAPPAAAAPPSAPKGQGADIPSHGTPLNLEGPAVIFFRPSQAEQDAADPVRAAALLRFQGRARELEAALQHQAPDLGVQTTDAEELMLGGARFHRADTCGYGCIVFIPPHPPEVLEGLPTLQNVLDSIASATKK